MYLQGAAKEKLTCDAIVVGPGIRGGWGAKELCEKGWKGLVRCRKAEHIKDYPTTGKHIWELPHRNRLTLSAYDENPIREKRSMSSTNTRSRKPEYLFSLTCLQSLSHCRRNNSLLT
jgi:choline dehydrogenase-like flavoprotein